MKVFENVKGFFIISVTISAILLCLVAFIVQTAGYLCVFGAIAGAGVDEFKIIFLKMIIANAIFGGVSAGLVYFFGNSKKNKLSNFLFEKGYGHESDLFILMVRIIVFIFGFIGVFVFWLVEKTCQKTALN